MYSVGRQIVNVPSFVVRLDSQKVRPSPVPSSPYASLSLLTCTHFMYFHGDVHTSTAYRLCAHFTLRWRPRGTREEEACRSRQQGWRGGGGGVDDLIGTFTSPRLSARPPGEWNPVYGAIKCYVCEGVCNIIGREMPLCCSMQRDKRDANSVPHSASRYQDQWFVHPFDCFWLLNLVCEPSPSGCQLTGSRLGGSPHGSRFSRAQSAGATPPIQRTKWTM